MDPLITIIVSTLLTAFVGVIVAYARYVHNLKERVAVLERTIEDLQTNMKQMIEELRRTMEHSNENFQKIVESIQKRQDSHSKKQDDIMNLLTDFKMEMLKEVGTMSSKVSSLASDVKNLSNLITITDVGIKVDRSTKKK